MFKTIQNMFGNNNVEQHITATIDTDFLPTIEEEPKMPTVPKSYAAEINDRFWNTKSHFVTLQTRAESYITKKMDRLLKIKMDEFKRRHKNVKQFSDLRLCQSLKTTLDNIIIDETMQRQLINKHIDMIISKFVESKVMAIQVYEDPEMPGKYIAWDGQHTAISLYVLATQAFNQDTSECVIPITVYPLSKKHEIRQNFIGLNGDDKEPLDMIDVFEQQIHTVRTDKVSTDPKCVEAELKQQYLEKHDLFVTADKFNNSSKIGAISRMNEIVKFKPDITDAFGTYFNKLNQKRAVNSTEIPAMMLFFDECVKAHITLTDAYIQEVADILLDAFDADFSKKGDFWKKAEFCYFKWHAKAFAGTKMNPKFTKNEPNGVILIISLLKKKMKNPMNLPNFQKTSYNYSVNPADIW